MSLPKIKLLKGNSPDIIHTNVQSLKGVGHSHPKAVRIALSFSTKGLKANFKRPKTTRPKAPTMKSVSFKHPGLYE
jgi:hypothetical protein